MQQITYHFKCILSDIEHAPGREADVAGAHVVQEGQVLEVVYAD